MKAQLGPGAEDFFTALQDRPETSILLNPNKSTAIAGEQIGWNRQGRYLSTRPDYVLDPHYHGGAYYPQEASSMVIARIIEELDIGDSAMCLDLCGAPGGKSLNLLQALPAGAFLVSNEVIRSRVAMLNENLRKWGAYNVATASIHPSDWRDGGELFDLILVDAPCSGEGMFRKEGGKAIAEWSQDNVIFCAERQYSILNDIIPCLRPGGFLIYSTCTYSEEENAQMLGLIASQGFDPVPFDWPKEFGFMDIGVQGNAYQAYPHLVRGEGLFFSVFQKEGYSEIESEKKPIEHHAAPVAMRIPEGYRVSRSEDQYFLESSGHAYSLERIHDLKGSFSPRMPIGQLKGKDFIPAHELAMTDLLQEPNCIELDHDLAIKYLRRETFPLPNTMDGWYVAQYGSTNLGWIKVASGRMKNHYPKGWMIRKRW